MNQDFGGFSRQIFSDFGNVPEMIEGGLAGIFDVYQRQVKCKECTREDQEQSLEVHHSQGGEIQTKHHLQKQIDIDQISTT